jgi:zinc D-Ala-D-Ala dipeptidase
MRRYSIFFYLAIILLNPAFYTIAQSNNNQLFIIKNNAEYHAWTEASAGARIVKLSEYVSPLFFDVPYQTKKNFTGIRLYRRHSFWVVPEAAKGLTMVQDSLKKLGLSLYFFDTYRPYTVTKKMWEIVPDERYAANPANGSGHNRGLAVDVTLAYLTTGQPLPMPTGFDNFSDTAHHGFQDLPEQLIKNRDILKGVMEHYGFKALSTEWWHYSLPNARDYPLLDLDFKELEKAAAKRKR